MAQLLARLTLPARTGALALAGDLVRATGRAEGLGDRALDHLESAVDEACTNVLQHAFDAGESGTFDLILTRRMGQLVAAVEDRGLPFDQSSVTAGKGAGLGLKLMRAFAKEVHLINLGSQGKRTELVFDLPSVQMDNLRAEGEEASGAEVPMSLEPVQIRRMAPEEAPQLARCVYRTYGYTYAAEALYRPEQVQERMQAGLVDSLVAVTPSGELVAHLALIKAALDARIAETGQAVVAPAFRGRKLFEQMKAQMVGLARDRGLAGIYSEAVTIHPATQKGNHALGAVETGLLLGYIPGHLFFGKETDPSLRQSAMLYYLPLNPGPEQQVFLPFHHSGLAREIYDRLGLKRRISEPPVNPLESLDASLEVLVRLEWNQAYLRVRTCGTGLKEQVEQHLRALCLQKLECIYLDLPLEAPATAQLCGSFEHMGFSFAGILPEGSQAGDLLRLQYLNNVPMRPEKIMTVTPFGAMIKNYVLDSIQGAHRPWPDQAREESDTDYR
jgi:serine/threonine-protein kinase RsbW